MQTGHLAKRATDRNLLDKEDKEPSPDVEDKYLCFCCMQFCLSDTFFQVEWRPRYSRRRGPRAKDKITRADYEDDEAGHLAMQQASKHRMARNRGYVARNNDYLAMKRVYVGENCSVHS